MRGNSYTQGIENFLSLLERTLKNTYVRVELIPSVAIL